MTRHRAQERASKVMRLAGMIVAAALTLTLALGAGAGAAGAAGEAPVITYKVVHSQSAYPQGGVYPLAIELTIRPGYHINSERPAEPDLYPTSLILSCTKECSLSPAVFPPAHAYKPTWQEKPIQVFDGKVLVRFKVTVDKAAKPGQQFFGGRLNYQACDDSSCLMPETLDLSIPLQVVPAGQAVEKLNPAVFKK